MSGHGVSVGWVPDNHGYPYRATCSCGWQSRTYVARHAAQMMADDHVAGASTVAGTIGAVR
jgi:hypothetical protein